MRTTPRIIAVALAVLGLALGACGSAKSRTGNIASTTVASGSGANDSIATPPTSAPAAAWTRETSGPPIQAVWDTVCCNALPSESPALPTGNDVPADGFYAVTFADWPTSPTDADPELNLARFRSCADAAFRNATTSDCLILDQPFSVDHAVNVKRTFDLDAVASRVWIVGHACEGADVGFTNWSGGGTALRDLEARFEADYQQWVVPHLPADSTEVFGESIPPAVVATGSPFSRATCTAGLEWSLPNGPSILLQGLVRPSPGQAAVVPFLSGRAIEVSAGSFSVYLYAAYRP